MITLSIYPDNLVTMTPTLAAFLSFFSLLLISTGVYALSRRVPIPYTVLLVLAGLALIPLSHLSWLDYIDTFKLTPDLLFFVFLPTLIFESAYHMKVRHVLEHIRSITLLAVFGLILSACIIACLLYYLLAAIGFPVPFIVLLLFGVIISATDPVAVLALFKEYGAPQRLSLIFEGESLFNDGTAFAIFLIVIDIITQGWNADSLLSGIFIFISMVAGGVLFGALMGYLFSKMIEQVRNNEHIEVTLTMIVAHMTFILSELITHTPIFGYHIHISSIIATVIAAMVIGNYGQSKISPQVLEYMERFWSYFAFVANSIVFILIGLLFASLDISITQFILPISIAIIVIMIARALSVYLLIPLLNAAKWEKRIPASWQHLLAWGSLRGALAVTMVLLIPDDLTLSGWTYPFSVKDFITALTIGAIYFTLFVKATTIGPLIKYFKLNRLGDLERVEYAEAKALVYARVLLKIANFRSKGYIDSVIYEKLHRKYKKLYTEACAECNSLLANENSLQQRMLNIFAIGIEKTALRNLYRYHEISEEIYKTISNELDMQMKQTEEAAFDPQQIEQAFTRSQTEHRLIGGKPKSEKEVAIESYMYYRARMVIARKAIKELSAMANNYLHIINNQEMINQTIEFYTHIAEYSREKMNEIRKKYGDEILAINESFAERGVLQTEEKVLEELSRKEIISPKLYVLLKKELGVNN